MTREYICQYGNCELTIVAVRVSLPESNERLTFCCANHAALYLLKRSLQTSRWKDDQATQICRELEQIGLWQ